MMKFLLIACILATFSVAISLELEQEYFHLAVERPDDLSSDCSNLIFEMADCIGFMTNQETTKPSPDCCKGLKTVLDANEKCVCYALEAAPSMGISINISRAEDMPSLCHITNAPPISKCNISGSPGPSPATPAPAPVTPSPPSSPALPPPSPAPVSPNPPPSASPTPATPPSSPAKPPRSPVSPTPPSSPPTPASPSIAPTVSIVPPSSEAPAPSSVAVHIQMPFLVSFSVVVASLFLF